MKLLHACKTEPKNHRQCSRAKQLSDVQLAQPVPLRPPSCQECLGETFLLQVCRSLQDTDPGRTSPQAHLALHGWRPHLALQCWKPASGAVDELPGEHLFASTDTLRHGCLTCRCISCAKVRGPKGVTNSIFPSLAGGSRTCGRPESAHRKTLLRATPQTLASSRQHL